ncbi:MAG: TetR/AcrR family transcriptional regulator [Methylacidiphilales bacterium]|nr:TetR/AcrR family transcriptional regulator [Candidatus Methylacidiphilales bacterium]NJR16355.1 TetR/AcrR family transcriptional regulator [Calothrix sp. CSU_2_0]
MKSPSESSKMRRQPQQQRSQERVKRILDAAVEVFDELGFEAATMNAIASRADTAIGSLYQFFPDKMAIFQALEVVHLERVSAAWGKISNLNITELPFAEFIKTMVGIYKEVFEEPISRLVFIQYFTSKTMFQRIDDSLTQQGIDFQANLLKARNPNLCQAKCNLLAEVCVQAANALIVVALRGSEVHKEEIFQQIEELLLAYLLPYDGDKSNDKVMICPQCDSRNLSKNGFRHGKQRYLCKDCGRQFLAR